MFSGSRILALIPSIGVSLIITIIVAVLDKGPASVLAIIFFSCFLTSYLCFYFLLEAFVFRDAKNLKSMIAAIRKGERPEPFDDETQPRLAPVKEVYDEILQYVEKKQEEIDHLRKQEMFRRDFIANVSHELKTPIFAAQGFLHTLLDGAVNDRAVRMKFLRKAARSLDGLDALVQDLLVLSHIETGQIKMQFEEFDLYKITEEVFEQFEEKLSRKNISLRIENPQSPVMAYGDPQRIAQVLTNLVSNAIRHSFDDGEVVVRFNQNRRYVEVSVRDDGEGIPLIDQSRIFERFYRVDKSRTKKKGRGGTGLGLAIVKHILEGHNTRADVESAPGRGSIFSFKLPRFKPEEPES